MATCSPLWPPTPIERHALIWLPSAVVARAGLVRAQTCHLPPGWRVGGRVLRLESTPAHRGERGRASAAAGRVPAGLRDLPARPGRPRADLERRRAAAEGLPGGRDHRPALLRRSIPRTSVEVGLPERILESARAHGRHEAEGWRVRKDGTRFWADVVITALRDERRHARRLREGHARPHEPPAGHRADACGGRGAAGGQRRARAVPAAGRERARLRDLRARRLGRGSGRGTGRGEHQGLHGRGGRSAATSSSSTPRRRAARKHPAYELRGRGARGPLRGGGLARPQGRHAVLGQRRDHRAARRATGRWWASRRSRAT